MKPLVYLTGSLRNPRIPELANLLEELTGFEVFADWFAAGELADDQWKAYELSRGHSYVEALKRPEARHVFGFDRTWIHRADLVVLAMPASKSAFLELGYALGRDKPGFILLDPTIDRWDVMFQFATGVATDVTHLTRMMKNWEKTR